MWILSRLMWMSWRYDSCPSTIIHMICVIFSSSSSCPRWFRLEKCLNENRLWLKNLRWRQCQHSYLLRKGKWLTRLWVLGRMSCRPRLRNTRHRFTMMDHADPVSKALQYVFYNNLLKRRRIEQQEASNNH